jgi:protein TonB
MDDAVSNVLDARTHGSAGLAKMLLASVAAHIALMTFAALAPTSLWQRPTPARSATVTIDLGPAAPGADSGGLTSLGVRPVQRVVADQPMTRPTPPPAARTPESVLPELAPRITTRPTPPPVDHAPRDARGRTPVDGSETRAGDASAATAAQSTSTGLSTSIAGGGSAQPAIGDFCCPDYIAAMFRRIHQHWNAGSGVNASAVMTFAIQRDGTITQMRLTRSSGNQMLDFLAERALRAVGQLPPLPDAYPHQALVLDLEFKYQR